VAGEVVGKATYETELDRSGLQEGLGGANQDIAKSGATAEQAFGKAAAEGPSKWGVAAKAAGAVGAVAFGGLALAANQAQKAQGDYMAETGKSRVEAQAFVKDMDGLAGSVGTVGMSFEDITKTGTAVAVQFGLTGKAGADMTESFAEFAKVTGQDASGAVEDFDGLLDAFKLPASAAVGLMDQLVASHQKYGTDAGPEAVAALTKMAPALQGMNLSLDDGVGLLNLFEDNGLNADAAMRGLQTAVKNMKPGETFDDLITQVSSIEDPTLRAQKAMDLFGTKAGSGLALALKPGVTSLDAWKVTTQDAAGSTTKAATDMTTDADKLRGAMDKLAAGARDLGQEFGPALTGLGSLVSLVAPMAGKLKDFLVQVAKVVLPTAVAQGGITGAAEGEAHAVASTGAGIVSSFLQKFGLMTPAKVAAATAAGALEGAAEGEASAAAAAGPKALAGAKGAGGLLGGTLGVAAGVAIGLALDQVIVDQEGKLRGLVHTFQADLGTDPLLAERAAAAKGPLSDYIGVLGEGFKMFPLFGSASNKLGNDLTDLSGAFTGAKDSAINAFTGFNVTVGAAAAGAGTDVAADFGRGLVTGSAKVWPAVTTEWAGAAEQGMAKAGAQSNGVDALAQAWIAKGKAAVAPFIALGKSIPANIADGALGNGKELLDAGDRLIDLLKNGMSPAQEAAKLTGKKYTQAVAQGMTSEIPGAKLSAQQMAVQAIATIDHAANGAPGQRGLKAIGSYYDSLLAGGMGEAQAKVALAGAGVSQATLNKLGTYNDDMHQQGATYSSQVGQGITSKSGTVTAAAQGVQNKLDNMPWGTWGSNVGSEYGSGLARGINGVNFTGKINHLLDTLKGFSPPRTGPIREAVLSAVHVGEAYGDNLVDGIVERTTGRLGEVQQALVGAMPQALLGGGGLEVRHVVQLDLRNAPAGVNSADVAAMLQPVTDWDTLWSAKMHEAQANTGTRWVEVR
jgi:hypothetical protein